MCAITALPGVAGTVRFPQLLVQLAQLPDMAQLCDIWPGNAASRLTLLPQLRERPMRSLASAQPPRPALCPPTGPPIVSWTTPRPCR